MEKDLRSLRQFLEAIHPVSDELWQDLQACWQPVVFKRKTILTAAGETERYLYFVTEGIQRAFYLGPDDRREATVIFTYPPSFSGVADSFLTQTPSTFYLETLTASRLLRIGHDSYQELLVKHPAFKDLTFHFMAQVIKGILVRQAEIQCFTAEEKFRSFLTRSPHMLNLVPHKYLASYLSIDPSTFSRLLATAKL
ncbi:Crp/Fnr family transcriptional regulator [Flavilitoribacter nigricans]|uniref:Cyclic nucleotide-binding protein n=1 Tax=Flavilitoribacter nigricans (strain ATCC 23147 / DSM 23189 / NBRC 102662 / NCIMB 1420 / SS-2) TaxID=1122177 RepID=A0A2D0NHY8_FLAN2|nr:Crp/Fnr family transcriptional regulator [Flavilitoribacter nigricans]PHN07383.1 cyclic nucleotide-binding protein [Flavilitoribacter nigricans DSM 23189 = NBRC 102662]